MFRRRSFLLAAGSVLLFATIVVCAYVGYLHFRRMPGELVVLPDAECAAVTIISPNLISPVVSSGAGTVRLSPISHGPYTLAVRFRDGQTAWVTFFHGDTGRCPKREIRLKRHPNNRIEVIYCVIDWRGHRTQSFADTVGLTEMSAEHPLILDWI